MVESFQGSATSAFFWHVVASYSAAIRDSGGEPPIRAFDWLHLIRTLGGLSRRWTSAKRAPSRWRFSTAGTTRTPGSFQPAVEILESRIVLDATQASLADMAQYFDTTNGNPPQFQATGVTIVTHGFQLTDGSGDSLGPLAQAIHARTGGWLLDYDVPDDFLPGYFDLNATHDFYSKLPSSTSGEVVLLFDWAAGSNQLSSGWGEAAGDALFGMLVGLHLVDPAAGANSTIPLHFIAHSFGSAVTSEAVERLAYFNVPVDQVTYLDPHDFNQGLDFDGQQRLFDLGKPLGYGAAVWDNVAFADVYYQTEALPSGRPISGAYNFCINGHVDGLSAHTQVWDDFYIGSLAVGSGTGFDYSSFGTAPRPAPAFFGGGQDYRFSNPTLVDITTGLPNLNGLAALGLTVPDIDIGRWAPVWNPNDLVVNGDFEDSGLLGSFNDSYPGWSHYGGGGLGHIDLDGGNHYLELDVGNESRTHNDFYFPADANALTFELWVSDRSSDDLLAILIDGVTFGNLYSLTTSTDHLVRQSVPIPPSLRGLAHTVGFKIISSNLLIDSEVRIDNVRVLNDFTPPIVDAVVVSGITTPTLISTNFSLPTVVPSVFAVSAGVLQMNGSVVLGAVDLESGIRLNGYLFHTQAATDSTGLSWGSTRDWAPSTANRTIEEFMPGVYRIWVSAENIVGLTDDTLPAYRYFQIVSDLPDAPLPPLQTAEVFRSIGTALQTSAEDLIGSSQHDDITGKFPFAVEELYDVIDLPGMFDQFMNRFVQEPEIIAPLGSAPTSFILGQDVRFVVSGDGLALTEVVVLATATGDNVTLGDLILDIDAALAAAGIGDALLAVSTSDGRLILRGRQEGMLKSLVLTTLRLTSDGTLPLNGQITNPQTSSPSDTFNLRISREISNGVDSQNNAILVSTMTDYHIPIGTFPAASSQNPFAFTQDNISLADLVVDLKMAFLQQGLSDIVAVIDANNQLALVATSPEVKTIEVLRRTDNNQSTGLQFGFANSLTQTINPNLVAGLGFVPARNQNVGTLKFDSVESFLTVLEDEMHSYSDSPLPDNFALDPVYDSNTKILLFNFALNKVFTKPTELDFLDQGITLGSLGTLQAAAVADANLTATLQLNFRMGLSLEPEASLLTTTPLSALNAGNGVRLAVGLTGVTAPAGAVLANNVQFTVTLNGSAMPVTVTLLQTATSDNVGLSDLAADLNTVFGTLPALAGKIQATYDVSANRLALSALSQDVYSLQIADISGLISLGFGSLQSGSRPELKITVGGTLIHDPLFGDLLMGGTPYLVDLVDTDGDGVMSIHDVEVSIFNQTNQNVTVTIDGQSSLKLQTNASTIPLWVQAASTNGINSLAGLGLGILGISSTGEITGTPLLGASLSDRVFILENQPSSKPKDLTLTVRVDATLTVGAALGTIEVGLRSSGPTFFQVTAAANLNAPATDHRLYLNELLNAPFSAIDGLPSFSLAGGGTFDVSASLTSGGSLLGAIEDGTTAPPLFSVAVAVENFHFKFHVSQHFEELLTQFQELKIDDVLFSIRSLVTVLQESASLDALNTNIPLLNLSLNDALGLADGLLDGIDSVITTVDLGQLSTATNELDTAVSNLSLPYDARRPLFRAMDLLRQVPNGNVTKIPGRLISVALVLKQLIEAVPVGTVGEIALDAALVKLVMLVPSLNTLEDRLAQGLEGGLRSTFKNQTLHVDVTLGFVDYDGLVSTKDRAVVVGLKVSAINLLETELNPQLPLTAEFGPLQMSVDPVLHLHAGGSINIGVGVQLPVPGGTPTGVVPFLLVADSTTAILPDKAALTDLKTRLDLNVGFDSRFNGAVQIGSLDLIQANVDLSLLRSVKDEHLMVSSGVVQLTKGIPSNSDGRFVIVVDESNGHVLAWDDYHFAIDTTTSKLTFTSMPPTGLPLPTLVTVEYQTGIPVQTNPAIDRASDPNNRAALSVYFTPTQPILNKIGAVAFSQLSAQTDLKAELNGHVVGSVGVTLLNSHVENAVTLTDSLSHVAQPQLVVDADALGDLLNNVDFNFCLIVEGVEAFLTTLQDGLQSQILSKLPLVGKSLNLAGTFLGKLQTEFLGPFDAFVCDQVGSFAQVELNVEQFIFDKLGPAHQGNNGLEGLNILGDFNGDGSVTLADVQATLDTQHFEILFKLHGEDKQMVDFDTALDGLPITAGGQGGVEFGWAYDVDFGIGVDRNQGFYFIVNENADPEITLDIGAGLTVDTSATPHIPTTLTVDLFGLKLTATDILTLTGETGTHIGGVLTVDLSEPTGTNLDQRLLLSEITSHSFGEMFEANLSLGVAINLQLAASISSDLPSVQTDFIASWTAEVTTTGGQINVAIGAPPAMMAMGGQMAMMAMGGLPTIMFKNVGINLGDFLSKQIGAALDKVNKYIEPIKPLIKLLKQDVPGVSELSIAAGNGPITFLDLALLKNPDQAESARKFVDTIDTIIGLIDSLKTVDGNDDVLFVLVDTVNLIDSGTGTVNTMNAIPAATPINTPAPAAPGNTSNKLRGLLDKIESIGIHLDILEPKNIVSLLLHQPFDIIAYKLPYFSLDFTVEQSFQLSPLPIQIRIGLDASLFADLSIGYDSHGIDTGRFLDGFYFGDRAEVTTGDDIEEFGVSLGVRLAALLGVGPVNAGVEGEIQANIFANWRDTDGDGKMHLDEIRQIVQDGDLACLFDLHGELRAIVRLVYQIAGIEGSKEFINEILLSYHHECPEFELGEVTSDGTLLLNAGPRASLRRAGVTSDVDEDFTVTQLAPGVYNIEAMGLELRYSGVFKKIVFDGGAGSDRLRLIGVTIPVEAYGGPGNDWLEGGTVMDTLNGGAGNDSLVGRGDADTLSGGAGDDMIYGDPSADDMTNNVMWGAPGSDTIFGDEGRDLIFGGFGNDLIDGEAGSDMIFGQAGDDTLRGGSGDDQISGGLGSDYMFGDAGNDALVGGVLDSTLFTLFNDQNPDIASIGLDGGDVIWGGTGNDLLIGGAGSDSMFGGWGDDAILGYRIQNHDDISPDYIEGGPDNDFICGANGNDTILGGTGDLGLASILADQATAGMPSTGGYHLVSCDDIPTYTEPPVGTISGQVFRDNNGNTLQQAAEPGLNVWTVNLLDAQNAVVDNDITADKDLNGDGVIDPLTERGWYSFDGVDTGAYYIAAVLLPGYAQTTVDQLLTVADGQSVLNAAIGERFQPTVISGHKFEDTNGNGTADLQERGVNGWEVQLRDTEGNVLATQLTQNIDLNGDGSIDPISETGRYAFSDLVPGTYTVTEAPRAGWIQSFPLLSAADVVLPLADDGYNQTRSAALVAGLGGAITKVSVALDLTHADVQQLTAILTSPSGTQVRLFRNVGGDGDNFTGTVFDDASATMISTGMAPFTGSFRPEMSLAAFQGEDPNGTWTLTFDDDTEGTSGNLDGWSITVITGTGTTTGIGGAVDPKSPGRVNSYQLTVELGALVSAVDFANYRTIAIRGEKFEDLNGNGQRDEKEPGLSGVEIYIDLNHNGEWDREEPKTRTQSDNPATEDVDETGIYELTGLPPSPVNPLTNQPTGYTVAEVLQPGWVQSFPGVVQPISPLSLPLSPLPQAFASPFLAPLPPNNDSPGAIHGQKFEDVDHDGVHDAGELGLNGWTIQLVNAAHQVIQMTTTMDLDLNHNGMIDPQTERGQYLFTNVEPGTYTVQEVLQQGWAQSAPAAGSYTVVVSGDTFLYTITDANQLAAIDVLTHITTIIGVTQDSPLFAARRIRGLAYDSAADILYGMTREGNLVEVDRTTGHTTFLYSMTTGNPLTEFWSGLAFDGANHLYTTNAFGRHELVELTRTGNSFSEVHVGNTTFNNGAQVLTVLGLDFYPSSAPAMPSTFNGTDPTTGILYGSNRNNNNIVVVNTSTGALSMPFGSSTVGVGQMQEIAFHPVTGELYAIHDHSSQSSNAALSVYNFTTATSTEWGELPFGIVENLGPGGGTFGWGGLAFAPAPLVVDDRTYDFANFQRILLPDGDDSICAGAGNDIVYGDNLVTNPLVVSVGSRRDTLLGDSGVDMLFGQEEDDILSGGPDEATPSNDILDGGTGIDRVLQELDGNQTLNNSQLVGEGTDAVISIERATLIGGVSANMLDATLFTLGPVTLIGMGGGDTLRGSASDDFLQGDDGDDLLDGGAGNDTYVFAGSLLGTDTIIESANQSSDTLDFSEFTQAVVVDLQLAASQTVGAGNLVLVLGDAAALENVLGGSFNDTIHGNSRNNTLVGGSGNDVLFGLGGDDTLSGGLDDDVLDGGADSDLLMEAGSGDFILTNASLSGIGNDVLIALEAADLMGDAGPNRFTVSGWTGTGNLDGAGGSDTVISVNDANFTLTDSFLSVSGGANLGLIGIMQALLTGGVGDNFIDASGFSGTTTLDGGAGQDLILGGSGRDTLLGGSGADTLIGGGGNDVLDGGADGDQLSGDAGNDVYFFQDNWGNDSVAESPGQGIDTLDFGAVTTGIVIHRGAVTLSASDSSSNSVTHAGDAIERLMGGGGDDTFAFDNGVNLAGGAGVIDGGDGINSLDYSTFNTPVSVNLALGQGTGLNSVQHVQRVLGGSAADQLIGDGADNSLFGNGGNDTLNGGKGKDTLAGGLGSNTLLGGAGDDSFLIAERLTGSETDHLQEDSGTASGGLATRGGEDTVDLSSWMQSVTFNLGTLIGLQTPNLIIKLEDGIGGAGPDNYENVIGSLLQPNNLTGNAANNALTGGVGPDALTGGNGNDVLLGGAGNDLLMGGDGDDTYLFAAASTGVEIDQVGEADGRGVDTLDFSALSNSDPLTLTLTPPISNMMLGSHFQRTIMSADGANFENVIGGSGHDQLTGNAANNHLVGGDGNDVLDGANGNDLLEGGLGTNSLQGGGGDDTLVGGPSDTLTGGSGNNLLLQGVTVMVSVPQFPDAPQLELVYTQAGNTMVQGILHGRPLSLFTLKFFASTDVTTPLHTMQVTSDGNGNAHFMATFAPAVNSGTFLTTTATDAQGNISQLSSNLQVRSSVDLELGLTVDDSAPLTGNTFHYTVSIQNTGLTAATGVKVKDQLPAGVTYVSSTPSAGTYDSATGIWVLGNLAPGATATLIIAASVKASAAGLDITNTAFLTAVDQVDILATNDVAEVTTRSPFAMILGRKFADGNGNGIQDAGEAGLSGWIIELRDLQNTLLAATTTTADDPQTGTDEAGLYSFALASGTYQLTEVLQPGWEQTLPGNPSFRTVTVMSGQTVDNQDFGNHPTGTLVVTSGQDVNGQVFGNYRLGSMHGIKFRDLDRDGHYDVEVEPRLPNVQFTLTGTTGMGQTIAPAVQVVTDQNGEFSFVGLAPGSYTVTETVPAGDMATTPTSFRWSVTSGEEVVAIAGQANLLENDPRYERVIGQGLMFGNAAGGVDLEVVKTESRDPVFAGSGARNLTYIVTVTNHGPLNATGVMLSEDLMLPSGVMLVLVTPSAGTSWSLTTSPDGTWNVGNLPNGASATLTIVLTVSAKAASGTNVIRNTATVTATNETRINQTDDTATVNTSIANQLVLGETPVTWTNRRPPMSVSVLPHILVKGDISLAGGTLTISVNAIGTARKLIDQFVIPATAGLGSSLGQSFANGKLMLQIQLSEAVTSSDIQSFLQRITFATKGKGLRTLTRTMDVTLMNAGGVIGVVQQTIHVRKKA